MNSNTASSWLNVQITAPIHHSTFFCSERIPAIHIPNLVTIRYHLPKQQFLITHTHATPSKRKRWHWHSNDDTHINHGKAIRNLAAIITRAFCTDIVIYPRVKTLCLGKKCRRLNKGCVLQFMEDTFRWNQASNIQFSFKYHLLENIKCHEMTELEVHINVRPETDLIWQEWDETCHPWAR